MEKLSERRILQLWCNVTLGINLSYQMHSPVLIQVLDREVVVRKAGSKRGVRFAKAISCLHTEYNDEYILRSTAGKVTSYGAKPPSPNVAICHIKSFNNN